MARAKHFEELAEERGERMQERAEREEQTEIEQAMRGAKKGKSAQRRVKQSEEQLPPSLMFLCHGVVGFTDHFLPVLSYRQHALLQH